MIYWQVRKLIEGRTLIDDDRLQVIRNSVILTRELEGCMVEVGTYKGGSAYLIAQTNPEKHVFVCDTFEGLPETTDKDINNIYTHKKGEFLSDFNEVSEFLNLPNITVVKGRFPQQIQHDMENKKYSFVHLDVDLYQETLNCLEFFYPRMTPGGIIISDDYTWDHTPGVKAAFDEFFNNLPEKVEDSGFKSCIVIKA